MKRVIAEAELYMDLIVPEDELRFCFELVDTGEAATIVLKEEPEVVEGSIDPDARLFTTRPAYCVERPTSSASRPEPRWRMYAL